MGPEKNKKPQPFGPFSEEKISYLLNKIKNGNAQEVESLILAEEILKSGRPVEALTLYEETNKPLMDLNEKNKALFSLL